MEQWKTVIASFGIYRVDLNILFFYYYSMRMRVANEMYAFSGVFAKIYVNRRTKVSNSSQVNYCRFWCPFRKHTFFVAEKINEIPNVEHRKKKKYPTTIIKNKNKNRLFFRVFALETSSYIDCASLSTTARSRAHFCDSLVQRAAFAISLFAFNLY